MSSQGMSSTSSLANPPSGLLPSDATRVATQVARLRAEQEIAESAATRALLLHEIGLLEERLGDEGAAARDLLAAVNAEPEFCEPLERLIAIIERRQSYKNLGKLLERLVRVADSPAERTRALIDQAAYLADHEDQLAAAKDALVEASEQSPDEPTVWLALELLASKLGDRELGDRALAARADLAQDITWRALLLLDLAQRRAESDDTERALETLDRAIGLGGEATFHALLALESLARRVERPEAEARSLETQGELILRALTEPADGDALGVPRSRRSHACVADAWLRAAEVQRQRGELDRAATLLDRALSELPDDLAVVHARLSLADATGDTALASKLSKIELDRGVDGEIGAALWLRVAEAAAAEGDGPRSLEAVERAVLLSPACVPARALELDLLAAQNDPARLASALEATADELETDAAKANFYLSSADIWARLARDVGGAKAALSQASMFGASPSVVARVARLLSACIGDAGWYEDATRRLLAQGSSEDEQASLWFELGRARALRGETAPARTAFEALATAPGGGFLGLSLGSYALPLIASDARPSTPPSSSEPKAWAALVALADSEADPETARALHLVVALRALLHGDDADADRQLDALHLADPTDLVVAGALAWLRLGRGARALARDVLQRTAETADDRELANALYLASGVLSFQLGDKQAAIEAFSRAAEDGKDDSETLLGWALRAADPNDTAGRSRAIDALLERDPGLSALERFTLEAGRGGSVDAAGEALERLAAGSAGDLPRAAQLARALWPNGSDPSEARRTALDELAAHGASVARLARAAVHQHELGGPGNAGAPDTPRALETAEAWARADASVAPALEWLAFAIAEGDRERELAARLALADRLPDPLASVLRASAALFGELIEQAPAVELRGSLPPVQLARLELSPPGTDAARRAQALLDAAPLLGEDSSPMVSALAGFNQLEASDLDGALASFRRVVEAHPEEVIGWEGLRAVAIALGDRATLAEASASLGDAVSDAELGAELWEAAATILIDELGDSERGEFALSRSVERDITRFSAFDRLFRSVRAKKNAPRLLDLISQRLAVADDPAEIVKLYWERARALRETGDREGAIAALARVRELEPEHVGALALTGEICITLGRLPEAAENLERLSRHAGAPSQQRLLSGVAAADLYENRLGDPNRALEVLMDLYRAGHSTLPVRERLARTAAKVGAWEQATEVLEQLMNQRETQAGRIEAARLAMAIYRDELGMAEAAQDAVTKLLFESPADGEALDLLLTDCFSESLTRQLLERGLDVLIGELVKEPMHVEGVDRVARIADKLDKAPLRQAALGALVALGADARAIDPELTRLDLRIAHQPRIAIDDDALPDLADPEDRGPLGDLMKAIASTVAEALGPGLAALGVGKKERVDPRSGLAVRNEVAAWAGALGIGEFELYVGGRDPHGVCAIATETPALVIGSDVRAPLSPLHRQAVARELLALRRGTSVLRHREPEEVHALVVAACRVAEVDVPSPPFALLAEFQRQLGREMPRRVRKVIPEMARAFKSSGQDPAAWYRAAISTLDRMAVIAAGDVSWVLAPEPSQRGRFAPTREGERRARRLLSFVLSPTYLELRRELGMGVR